MADDREKKTGRAADREVGKLIKIRRLQLGLSQAALGRILGVTYQQVQKYEQGQNRVNATTLHALAGALDVQTSYFFSQTAADGAKTPAVVVDDSLERFLSLPDARRIVLAFPNIKPARVRREVASFLERLAGSADA